MGDLGVCQPLPRAQSGDLLSRAAFSGRSAKGRGCHARCFSESLSPAGSIPQRRIAINHCQNLCQSWHNRHIHANSEAAVWENSPANTDSPLRVLETKELGQRIQKTLEALSDEYRLLLLLVADEELSYEEIAALVGQSADAVRGKLHRARKAFAAHFGKTV
jgi:RNA polymerase sigma factor (sigma-70 family)